jgi:putative hydroxymethylpyrimidine transport system substrate-binding protein
MNWKKGTGVRRAFGLVAAAVIAAPVVTGVAEAADKVNFALNWVPGPQHTEFVVAKYHGFFEAEGLDVDMHPPAASTDPIKLVASGQDEVGIGYAGDVIGARAVGVPVVSIAAIHRHIALGLLSRPEDHLTKPKDLEGKIIGLTPIPNNRAMFWDFVAKNNIDKSKLQVVTVQFNGPNVVAAKKADFADAVSWLELGAYKQITGEMPNYMQFTDYGVQDGYFFCIITSEKLLKQKPDLLRRFNTAVLKAEAWTVEHPDEAREILLAHVKEVSPEFAKQSRSIIDKIVRDDDTAKHGLGWQNADVWGKMADWYLDQKVIDKKIDPATAFSNDVLPTAPVMVGNP